MKSWPNPGTIWSFVETGVRSAFHSWALGAWILKGSFYPSLLEDPHLTTRASHKACVLTRFFRRTWETAMHSGIAFPLSSAVLSECVRPPCNNRQALESRGLVGHSFDSGWLGLAWLGSLHTVRVGLRLHFSIVWASPCVIFRNLGQQETLDWHMPVPPCFNQDTPAPLPPEAHWLEPVTWPHPTSRGSRKSEEIQLVGVPWNLQVLSFKRRSVSNRK